MRLFCHKYNVIKLSGCLEDGPFLQPWADKTITTVCLCKNAVCLRILGIQITATVRSNKTAKSQLRNDKITLKECSFVDYNFVENKDLFIKCNNNSVVTVGMTYQAVEPFASAKW